MDYSQVGRFIIFLGVILVIVGLLMMVVPKVFPIGKLPGDIVVRKKNFTIYFPIVTSIILSILLTIVLNLLLRIGK